MSDTTLKIFKNTLSLCPECYKKIPAFVGFRNDRVEMEKFCSEHGKFTGVVESSMDFYSECLASNAKNIYNGYFIDVTKKCNLKGSCKYCYYPVDNKFQDQSVDNILQEVDVHKNLAPIIITGGEPTLRKDLNALVNEIATIAPVELLTNGTFLDKQLIQNANLCQGDILKINLSIHPEISADNNACLDKIREFGEGKKLESVLFVIDDIGQIDTVVDFCEANSDVIAAARIKSATKVWDEQSPEDNIFVSEMLNYMISEYNATPVWWRDNKVNFFNTELNGIIYMLVSWYDVSNIDLIDINCPPFYKAQNGEVLNILTAMIVNEGISKGWLYGNRIGE